MHSAMIPLVRAQGGILERIHFEVVDHLPDLASPVEGVHGMRAAPEAHEVRLQLSNKDILEGNVDAFASALYAGAEQRGEAIKRGFLDMLDRASETTGQVVSGRGRPISHDVIIDALETMAIPFDEAGNPIMPELFDDEGVVEQLKNLPRRTPEQEARMRAVLDQKRKEFNARRRVRVLGRPPRRA